MTPDELRAAYREAIAGHRASVEALVPLLQKMAITEVAVVLPGADRLVTRGEVNENGMFSLRIERILDAAGEVIFDVAVGHDRPEVEDRIDGIGPEYLDPLLELTGDVYLGESSW